MEGKWWLNVYHNSSREKHEWSSESSSDCGDNSLFCRRLSPQLKRQQPQQHHRRRSRRRRLLQQTRNSRRRRRRKQPTGHMMTWRWTTWSEETDFFKLWKCLQFVSRDVIKVSAGCLYLKMQRLKDTGGYGRPITAEKLLNIKMFSEIIHLSKWSVKTSKCWFT